MRTMRMDIEGRALLAPAMREVAGAKGTYRAAMALLSDVWECTWRLRRRRLVLATSAKGWKIDSPWIWGRAAKVLIAQVVWRKVLLRSDLVDVVGSIDVCGEAHGVVWVSSEGTAVMAVRDSWCVS